MNLTIGFVLLALVLAYDLRRRYRIRKRLSFLARMSRGKIPDSLYKAMVKAIGELP